MKQEKFKYFFNASVYLLAGVISIIRVQPMEIIISFLFCGIFLALGTIQEKADSNLLSERYHLKINE